MSLLPKIGIVHFEPDLNGFSGHIYNTVHTIKEIFLANGHSYRVVTGNQAKSIDNEFLQLECNFGKIPKYSTTVLGNILLNPIIYNYLTFRAIIRTKISSNELLYFNTCQHLHIFGVLFACIFKKPKFIVLTFRLDTYHGFKSLPRVAWYFIGIKSMQSFLGHKLIFVTDSDGLIKRFKKIYGINLIKLPIPHLPEFKESVLIERKITIGSLGPASIPKNVLHTIDALKVIDKNLKNRIDYLLYTYGEQAELIENKLEKLNFLKINVIKKIKPVSRSDYLLDLEKTDIVMTNYLDSYYKYNTSGVFSEAYALNKLIITTSGTWMEENSHGCPGVIIIKNQSETAEILLYAINNYKEIQKSVFRPHSTENFYTQFTSLLE